MTLEDPDERILNKLHERVQAELQTANELRRQNDLAEESLKSVERVRQAETIRNRTWLDIAELTARLVQGDVPHLKLLLEGFAEKLDEYGEQLEALDDRLNRIEYGIMLLLSSKGNGNTIKRQELIHDIEQDRQQHLIEQKKTRLHELKLKAARYGIDVPPHIKVEIEDIEGELNVN